jgi:hypothetical protein
MPNVILLNIVILSGIPLSIILLSEVISTIIRLSVILLNVAAPGVPPPKTKISHMKADGGNFQRILSLSQNSLFNIKKFFVSIFTLAASAKEHWQQMCRTGNGRIGILSFFQSIVADCS